MQFLQTCPVLAPTAVQLHPRRCQLVFCILQLRQSLRFGCLQFLNTFFVFRFTQFQIPPAIIQLLSGRCQFRIGIGILLQLRQFGFACIQFFPGILQFLRRSIQFFPGRCQFGFCISLCLFKLGYTVMEFCPALVQFCLCILPNLIFPQCHAQFQFLRQTLLPVLHQIPVLLRKRQLRTIQTDIQLRVNL